MKLRIPDLIRLAQIAADRPVVLNRRQFMSHQNSAIFWSTADGPTEGLLMWIEPVTPGN